MPDSHLPPKTGGLTAMTGAMALIALLLIVQIWLLSASLESLLAGNRRAALPAAIFSALIFAFCFALYLFVDRLDAEVRRPPAEPPASSIEYGHRQENQQ